MNRKTSYTKQDMIREFGKGSWGYFIVGLFFALLASTADMLRPKIIQFTVDSIIGDGAEAFGLPLEYLKQHLLIPAIAVTVITAISIGLKYLYEMSALKGSEIFVCRMRDTLYRHILTLPASWHSENLTGDIIQRCTTDVEEVRSFFSHQMIRLVSMSITMIMALAFMMTESPILTLICAASIPLITGFSLIFHRKVGEAFMNCDIEEGVLSTIAQENLTGVRVVRAFGRERFEQERFHKQNHKVTEQWTDLGKFMALYWGYMDLQTGIIMLALLAVGSYLCVNGTFTVGGLLAMISYLAMLIRPVRGLGRILSELSKTTVSVTRLHDIMASEPERDTEDAVEAPMDGDIEFSHVSFAYPGQKELLTDLSFRIPAGTTLGILGNTGSGKSTIAGLLSRRFPLEPENGIITVGGKDIQHIKASCVRRNIGYVLQEPYLFSKSIRDNLSITDDLMKEEAITEAADAACLSETIANFTKGYDTFVGERGVTLSGGQKQRAAIARTLALKTPILIFDDSLSAVDTETDAKIRENLKKYMHNSTVILISHRITTLKAADNIIVLEDGKITDHGTHEELAGRPGYYQKICRIQQGEEETDEGTI